MALLDDEALAEIEREALVEAPAFRGCLYAIPLNLLLWAGILYLIFRK